MENHTTCWLVAFVFPLPEELAFSFSFSFSLRPAFAFGKSTSRLRLRLRSCWSWTTTATFLSRRNWIYKKNSKSGNWKAFERKNTSTKEVHIKKKMGKRNLILQFVSSLHPWVTRKSGGISWRGEREMWNVSLSRSLTCETILVVEHQLKA